MFGVLSAILAQSVSSCGHGALIETRFFFLTPINCKSEHLLPRNYRMSTNRILDITELIETRSGCTTVIDVL